MKIDMLVEDGQIDIVPGFLDMPTQLQYYLQLSKTLQWQQQQIKVYGRLVTSPRMQAWYGDQNTEYRYSGLLLNPLPWTPELEQLKQQVEHICECRFNSVLANWYRNGQDKMGFHSDNEKELGEQPIIASLSLGVTRKFVLKHKHKPTQYNIPLTPGCLLIMAGDTQNNYKHGVPQQKTITGGRINLTFRYTYPLNLA